MLFDLKREANLACRLAESFRHTLIPVEVFDPVAAGHVPIRWMPS